jgi:hypothetical protein
MYVATCYGLGSGRGDSLKNPARVKKDNTVATVNAFKSPFTEMCWGFCFGLAPLYHIVLNLVKCKNNDF